MPIFLSLDDSPEQDLHQRILRFLPYFDLEHDIDLLVCTRQEIEKRLGQDDRFIKRILQEKIDLL